MPLDPQTEMLLKAMAAMPALDFRQLTAPVFRQMAAAGNAMFAPGDAVARIENRSIPGPAGEIPFRLYYPDSAGPLPVTLFFHGGGFVICDLDSHDNICRCLAARSGNLVVSVDYRRAPEARFPAAVEDAIAALDWLQRNAAELGGDGAGIAVAGDSAGGNLATVVAQHARDRGLALRHQLLLYPVTDCRMGSRSYAEFSEGYYLTRAMMGWFFAQYLPDARAAADCRASPLLQKNLHGLAPATIVTAEYDPLRDEGEAYAEALKKAGVPVTLRRWNGQIHGFMSMLGVIGAADDALGFAAGALRSSPAAEARSSRA